MPKTILTAATLDRAGVVLSTSCALHCALMPVAVGVLTAFGFGVVASEETELLLLLSAAAIGVISLIGGRRHHRRARPLLMMVGGFALVLMARLGFEEGTTIEIATTVVGAALVASAHLVNARLCCLVGRP
ncbi:MAG: MerC domain-containing protein [Acidobacteria bacterium]|nr:MerC domain-containing protein [Acidobacteriota bacterium]